MKSISLTKASLWATLLFSVGTAFSQVIPANQWTAKERQFVEGARSLYQQQGVGYTNEQASMAVMQMRQQQAASPRGVPEAEWTAQERISIDTFKRQYAAQGGSISAEQSQMAVQAMRDQIAKIMGGTGAFQVLANSGSMPGMGSANPVTNAVVQSNVAVLSEEQLARTIGAWPAKQGDMEMRGKRDGFDINGRPVIDPEGKMTSYAYDVTTGSITYGVRTSRGLTIKMLSAANLGAPLVIANAFQGNSGWEVQTVTGKQVSGETLTVLSDGFLVGRSGSAFRYQPGKGIRSISIPDGYELTPLQRGNVGATGYVLLEKSQATGGQNQLEQILSPFKAIGSIIGINKKDDYALMDIETGKTFAFNIPADGKKITHVSQCRQRNWLISECQRAQTFEAVYGTDGLKNNSHYYWMVNWVGTPQGPVAFSLENGLANIFITDLNSGKKVLAFDRSFGIADWNATQRGDGKVNLNAKLAFDWKEIPDAVAFLNSNNAVAAVTPQ
jgi:hypothetical protein